MNPEIKQEWVARLRSGDYRQGHGQLVSHPGDGTARYCCLGVLCEQAREAGIGGWQPDDDGTTRFVTTDGPKSWSDLPKPVAQWAGLDDTDPLVRVGPSQRPEGLAALNDDYRTFEDLADLIEEQL
jgi:hypothetical protein